jgi:hypothetical protein
MSKKTGSRSAIGVGIATLVTIMVAVLLTTFSVLTLVTASADLRLSNKTVESAENYYAADGAAELWLADLDADGWLGVMTDSSMKYMPKESIDDDHMKISQEFPIDDLRVLSVEVVLASDGTIDILTWQSVLKK